MRREHHDDPVPGPQHHLDPFEEARQLQRRRQTRVAKFLVALFLAVLLIVFIVQNSKRVPIDFVFFTHQARLIWIMLFCAVVGGIVGFLVGRPGKQIHAGKRKDRQPPASPPKEQPPAP